VVLSSARRDAAALLLDVDGTLVDTAYLHTLAWQRACSANGFAVAAHRIHRLIGMGGDQFVPALLGEEVELTLGDALRDAWQEHYEPLMGEVRALPGAAQLIHRAHDEGWRVVFASSSPGEHLEHYLELLDATGLRDSATTSDDVARTKPAPDIVAVALELAGAATAVLIGDSTHDVRAAARAGIGCVGVLTGGYGEAELYEAGALAVHETPAHLAERLDDLERFAQLTHV
jgi:HAD superfamily hydrolase (TIGR01549 family)